jgi:DNA-nicking Smr family endonuclease
LQQLKRAKKAQNPPIFVQQLTMGTCMRKRPDIDETEEDIFQKAMRHVTPLRQKKKIDLGPTPPKNPAKKRPIPDEPELSPLSDYENLSPLSSEDLVEFKRSGIQHKILRKLRAGQYNVEAILDLHGMTVVEARETLYHFLLQCQQKGACHVLIVHGKGRLSGNPILKNKLNHWLRQLEQVLAFCSAKAQDGRSGAMYVLLKHQKGEIYR